MYGKRSAPGYETAFEAGSTAALMGVFFEESAESAVEGLAAARYDDARVWSSQS
jgi:hypothetical protein